MVTKNSHPHNSRKRVLLLALLVAVLLVGGIFLVSLRHHLNTEGISKNGSSSKPVNKINYSPSTSQDNASNESRKTSSNPAETLDNGPSANNPNIPLGVIIINTRRSGTDVRVGNMVTGTTSGTCTLSASQTGQTSPAPVTAPVSPDVNNYDCGVMHIALPDSGTWQLKLTVTSGSNSASATSTVGAS